MIGKHVKMESVLIDALNGAVLAVNMENATMFHHMENAELMVIVNNLTVHV